MINELFQALFKAALPVTALTFAMVYWSLRRGYLQQIDDDLALRQELKQIARAENRKYAKVDPVHRKWLVFGGGFYGMIALLTYIVVEIKDVSGILHSLGGLHQFLSNLSVDRVIGLALNIFIESIMNFVTAIAWPAYWIAELDRQYAWLWIVAAYAGYSLGLKLAQARARHIRSDGDTAG